MNSVNHTHRKVVRNVQITSILFVTMLITCFAFLTNAYALDTSSLATKQQNEHFYEYIDAGMVAVDSQAVGVSVEACGMRLSVDSVLIGDDGLSVLFFVESIPEHSVGTDLFEIVHLSVERSKCLRSRLCNMWENGALINFAYEGDINDAELRIITCAGFYRIPLSVKSSNEESIKNPELQHMVESDVPNSSMLTILGRDYMYSGVAAGSLLLYPAELVTTEDEINYEKLDSMILYVLEDLIDDCPDQADHLKSYLPDHDVDYSWINALPYDDDSTWFDELTDRIHECCPDNNVVIVSCTGYGRLKALGNISWCEGQEKETRYIVEDDNGVLHLLHVRDPH